LSSLQSLRLWRFPPSRPVPGVVRELGGEIALASIQPNYIYAPQGDASKTSPPVIDEYWLTKLKVDNTLDIAGGQPVRVAVIDTAIDEAHPDLEGTIEATYNAIGEAEPTHALDHGTSMAGAIAAHGRLQGVAPTVRILSARALDRDNRGLELGSTESVMKAIQWAFDRRARIINMSFAGPVEDPALHGELAAAYAKGLTLIGAAGNDGPKSPPCYPGADENVVAVTATDANDAVYAMANAGSYVAVAAPGVDVLLTSPNGGYAMETGTSVSAALVSGVAALLLERSPSAKPADVRGWLATTARPLAQQAAKNAVGAGLVDARGAADAAARAAEPAVAGAKLPGS
jgi:subtilisin family serine protease